MEEKLWLANGLLLLHAIVVGITVAGGIALFTGRFAKFNKYDVFAWAFIACSFGQIISLIFTGGCIFTKWEKELRLQVDPSATFAKSFLEEYLPFLPTWFITYVPVITLGALIGALVQIYFAIKRKRKLGNTKNDNTSPTYHHESY